VTLLVSAGLALGAFAVGCGGAGARVGSVTTLGDSLNVGIEPYLDEELGGWSLDHHNRSGRRTSDGIAELRALGRDVAPVVVVSLGTNDFDGAASVFREQVEDVLALAGPDRCVVWATIWFDGPHRLNAVLREAARRHRNLVLADWAALVSDEPELLAVDGLHGSPEGYERRAELVADLVRGCLPEPGA
jgi:lysophospholipase L1-like esterase